MITADDAGQCELVVKANNAAGVPHGWVYVGGNNFQPDNNSLPPVPRATMTATALLAGQEQTYTCVPIGSGVRIGVDRDGDGFFDDTEALAGSDPASNCSFPGGTSTTSTSTTTTSNPNSTTTTTQPGSFVLVPNKAFSLKDDNLVPVDLNKRRISFKSDTKLETPSHKVVLPAQGSAGDPTIHGGTLRVYNSSTAPGTPTDNVAVNLPANQWISLGSNALTGYRYD